MAAPERYKAKRPIESFTHFMCTLWACFIFRLPARAPTLATNLACCPCARLCPFRLLLLCVFCHGQFKASAHKSQLGGGLGPSWATHSSTSKQRSTPAKSSHATDKNAHLHAHTHFHTTTGPHFHAQPSNERRLGRRAVAQCVCASNVI